MAQFGAFKINVEVSNFVHGSTEIGPLEVGTYEPKSADELTALQHLASISYQAEGAEQSVPYAEQTEAPDAPDVPEDSIPAASEQTLSEPAGGAPSTADNGEATGGEAAGDQGGSLPPPAEA